MDLLNEDPVLVRTTNAIRRKKKKRKKKEKERRKKKEMPAEEKKKERGTGEVRKTKREKRKGYLTQDRTATFFSIK